MPIGDVYVGDSQFTPRWRIDAGAVAQTFQNAPAFGMPGQHQMTTIAADSTYLVMGGYSSVTSERVIARFDGTTLDFVDYPDVPELYYSGNPEGGDYTDGLWLLSDGRWILYSSSAVDGTGNLLGGLKVIDPAFTGVVHSYFPVTDTTNPAAYRIIASPSSGANAAPTPDGGAIFVTRREDSSSSAIHKYDPTTDTFTAIISGLTYGTGGAEAYRIACNPINGDIAITRVSSTGVFLGIRIFDAGGTILDTFVPAVLGGDCWTGFDVSDLGPIYYGPDGSLFFLAHDYNQPNGTQNFIWKIDTATGAGARTSTTPWFGPLDESLWSPTAFSAVLTVGGSPPLPNLNGALSLREVRFWRPRI